MESRREREVACLGQSFGDNAVEEISLQVRGEGEEGLFLFPYFAEPAVGGKPGFYACGDEGGEGGSALAG